MKTGIVLGKLALPQSACFLSGHSNSQRQWQYTPNAVAQTSDDAFGIGRAARRLTLDWPLMQGRSINPELQLLTRRESSFLDTARHSVIADLHIQLG